MTLPESEWNDSVAYINTQMGKDFTRMDRQLNELENQVDVLYEVLESALKLLDKDFEYLKQCQDFKARIDKV